MFHLTKHRWIFFGISGLIIIPGLLALIFWHLNLGIDFTNGATLTLRFQSSNVTINDISKTFQQAHAQDVQVYGARQVGGTPAHQEAYIQFNHPISNAEADAVYNLLQKANLPVVLPQKGQPSYTLQNTVHYPNTPASQDTALMVQPFSKAVSVEAIQAALKTLPPTAAPSNLSTSSATGATPAATASATPAKTATATATATSSSSGTYPVSVTSVKLGQNDQTYNVDTQTAYGDPAKRDAIVSELIQKYGPVYLQQYNEVGPSVANETTRSAFFAVLAACAAILLYIGIAFRRVGSWKLSLRFGASAIIALLHDAFVVLGLWAIFGRLFDFKVDTLFLTALLTVIGFSVHDTIVVFDRIRENLGRRTSESFDTIINASLVQTMSRSLNTSLTVLLTLTAEALFVGAGSTQEFVLALLIGIASGTYSSIFNASMILSLWEDWINRRRLRNQPQQGRRVAPRPAQRNVAATRA